MKKAFVALMVISTAFVAQANIWNVWWQVYRALAPEDPGDRSVSLFSNYGLTWELINETSGETIASTSLVNGSLSWDDTENNGVVAQYSDLLKPKGTTIYFGSTDETTAQSIYQKITLLDKDDPTKELWYWESDRYSVKPTNNPKDEPIDLGRYTLIAGEGVTIDNLSPSVTQASWTKVTTIPEPATMSLLGLGALAMMIRRRIRR